MSWLSTLTGVFFIGHSLFGPTNPDMFASALGDRGITVGMQIINGSPLGYNWDNGATAQGMNAREALATGGYNAVILTEAIPLANHIEYSDTIGVATRYYDLAVQSNPDARVFLQETWHDLRSGSGLSTEFDAAADIPWRDRLDQDLALWQSVVDGVNANRSKPGEPMRLLPAGQAIARLTDEIANGTVPGFTRIDQFFFDDIHPNDFGFYFLTMVQYAAVTGEPPKGIKRRLRDPWGQPFKALNPLQAQRLQDIAWEAVSDYYAAHPVQVARAEEEPPAPPPEDVAEPDQEQQQAPQESASPQTLAESFAPPLDPDVKVPMAIGLAAVSDWSVQQPFLDVFKTARPWIGHRAGEWGGANHDDLAAADYLDAHGWPVAIPPELGSIGTLILTDISPKAVSLAGRYRLRYDGKGVIEVSGRGTNVRYGKNAVEFDYEPGLGGVDLRIQRTHLGGDYVRNISVVKLDHVAAYDAGAIFNPLWLDRMQGFSAFRFMDWMETNDSTQSAWKDRPKPDDYTYGRHGVPMEIMVELLNRTGADGWFNMPHLADDAYIREFATYVRDALWIEQKAYVELSNEVWNWQFQQAAWAEEQAQARWKQDNLWVSYYAVRALEMAKIWSEVYGDQADDRLVKVISTQTGWLGLEDQILRAPHWQDESAENKAPATYFDAYAVTGYFSALLGAEARQPMVKRWLNDSLVAAQQQADAKGLSGSAHEEYVAEHRFDLATIQAWAELRDGATSGENVDTLAHNLTERLPYHAQIAEQYDLDLIMYEGGSHVVGVGPPVDDDELTAFLTHLNYTPEMGELYKELIQGWHAIGGKLFNAYADVYPANKWGSWGHLRFLSDQNPRWDVVDSFK